MRCEICGVSAQDGCSLYRINPKGVSGIWRCSVHLPAGHSVPPEVREICEAIEENNTILAKEKGNE